MGLATLRGGTGAETRHRGMVGVLTMEDIDMREMERWLLGSNISVLWLGCK